MKIRFAVPEDAPALLAIYGQYIDTSVTFEYELPSAAEFAGAVPCGDLPVAVGDTYDGEHFYRGGEKLDSPLALAQQEAQTLKEDIPMLKAQIKAISDRNDFVEDCIAEMATVVYADEK